MGIRQSLNENPVITTAVTGVIIVVALGLALKFACTSGPTRERAAAAPQRCFFTTDDGKTYFPDDIKKLPPFDHDGKPAVRAVVFRCPDGKEQVSHLERYSDADKKRIQEAMAKSPNRPLVQLENTAFIGVKEIKKPGAKDWVKLTGATMQEYDDIQHPKCNGSIVGLQWVLPD